MNIVDELIARVEDYRKSTKNPCKNYATYEAANKATSKMAQHAATYFDVNNRADAPAAQYVVFFDEAWGRWVGAINMSELLTRKNSTGGYMGVCTGFFTF